LTAKKATAGYCRTIQPLPTLHQAFIFMHLDYKIHKEVMLGFRKGDHKEEKK